MNHISTAPVSHDAPMVEGPPSNYKHCSEYIIVETFPCSLQRKNLLWSSFVEWWWRGNISLSSCIAIKPYTSNSDEGAMCSLRVQQPKEWIIFQSAGLDVAKSWYAPFTLLQQIYPKRRQFAPLPSSNYLLNIRKKGSACLSISPQGVVVGRSGVGRAEGGVKEDCLPGAALHSTSWPSPACSGS